MAIGFPLVESRCVPAYESVGDAGNKVPEFGTTCDIGIPYLEVFILLAPDLTTMAKRNQVSAFVARNHKLA